MKKAMIYVCAFMALMLACCILAPISARADTTTVECTCGTTLDLLNLPPGHTFTTPVNLICGSEVNYEIVSEIGGVHRFSGTFIVPHDFSGGWEQSETGHWHTCARPGCDEKSEIFSHVPDTADCAEDKFCLECEYLIAYAAEHDYDTVWSVSDTEHWRACKAVGCAAETGREAHNAGDPATCLAPQICLTCTKTLATAPHTFGDQYAFDATAHWRVCVVTGCDGVETGEPHVDDEIWLADDANHWRECATGCGYRFDLAAHEFSDEWYSDAEGHWNPCKQEGCSMRSAFAPHQFLEIWQSDVETHWHPCEQAGCDERGGQSEHALSSEWLSEAQGHWQPCEQEGCDARVGYAAHDFSDIWQTDAEGHWHACTQEGCTARSEFGAHEPYAPYSDCAEGLVCKVCELPLQGADGHILGDWESNEEEHWQVCAVEGCEYADEPAAHTKTTPSCKEDLRCSVCLRVLGEPIAHTWGTTWKSNDSKHWRVCAIEGCDGKEAAAMHLPGAGESCNTAHLCEICGRTLVAARGHSPGDTWYIDETGGAHYQICTRRNCGAQVNRGIHDWSAWESISPDYHARFCNVCDEIETGPHQYGDANNNNCVICDYVVLSAKQQISLASALSDDTLDANVAVRVMHRLLSALCPNTNAITAGAQGVFRIFLITNGTDTALCVCFEQAFEWDALALSDAFLLEAYNLGANYVAVWQPSGARIAPRPDNNVIPEGGLNWSAMTISEWYLAGMDLAIANYIEQLGKGSDAGNLTSIDTAAMVTIPVGNFDITNNVPSILIATEATGDITGTVNRNELTIITTQEYSHQVDISVSGNDTMLYGVSAAQWNGTIDLAGDRTIVAWAGFDQSGVSVSASGGIPGVSITGDNVSVSGSDTKMIKIEGNYGIVNSPTATDPMEVEIFGDGAIVKTGAGADTLTVAGEDSVVNAGAGNDNINVSGTGNSISAGEGDDLIYDAGGNTIHTNSGDDIVFIGSEGRSRAFGGKGKSTFFIKGGPHRVIGGSKGDAFFPYEMTSVTSISTDTEDAGSFSYLNKTDSSFAISGATYSSKNEADEIVDDRPWTFANYYVGVKFYEKFDPNYFEGKVKEEWFK